jgi:hypothetical protein
MPICRISIICSVFGAPDETDRFSGVPGDRGHVFPSLREGPNCQHLRHVAEEYVPRAPLSTSSFDQSWAETLPTIIPEVRLREVPQMPQVPEKGFRPLEIQISQKASERRKHT